jgi:hypothetical protein
VAVTTALRFWVRFRMLCAVGLDDGKCNFTNFQCCARRRAHVDAWNGSQPWAPLLRSGQARRGRADVRAGAGWVREGALVVPFTSFQGIIGASHGNMLPRFSTVPIPVPVPIEFHFHSVYNSSHMVLVLPWYRSYSPLQGFVRCATSESKTIRAQLTRDISHPLLWCT